MRSASLAILLAVVASDVRGDLPVIPPAPDRTAVAAAEPPANPVATAPAASDPTVPAVPAAVGPATAISTPWTVSCQPTSAMCPTACAQRPGILASVKNWLCGTRSGEACPPPCPPVVVAAPCPPPVVAVAKPKVRPLPVKPTVECPPCEAKAKDRFACVGSACSRIKAWLCWRPCGEQILPLRAEPYRAPVSAYFRDCDEPAAGLPCASGKKCGKEKCETGTCPQTVGPVVAAKPAPAIGWTPLNANTVAPASKVVPAGATAPVKAQPVNPIVRPFTSP